MGVKRKAVAVGQRGLLFSPTIQDRFEQFLAANPGFYEEFVRRTRALKQRGYKKFSADGILHSMRYDQALQVNSDGLYRINNDFSSRISRLVEERESDLAGFFEKRGLKAA